MAQHITKKKRRLQLFPRCSPCKKPIPVHCCVLKLFMATDVFPLFPICCAFSRFSVIIRVGCAVYRIKFGLLCKFSLGPTCLGFGKAKLLFAGSFCTNFYRICRKKAPIIVTKLPLSSQFTNDMPVSYNMETKKGEAKCRHGNGERRS